MNILVLNVGSSSLKYSLYAANTVDTEKKPASENKKSQKNQKTLKLEKKASGLFEKVFTDDQRAETVKKIKSAMLESKTNVDIIGHRVVHGREINKPELVTIALLEKLRSVVELAPLHELPELRVIEECAKEFSRTPQIAVFDTAFHSTMPEKARIYGLPYSYYEHGIKRYGFHGSSHKYVSNRAAEIIKSLSRPKSKNSAKGLTKSSRIITCHLGNGCSIAAVKSGKSIDTSMGFTPLEGLIMGTRSGTIDPGIVSYLVNKGLDAKQISDILNTQSGLLGISGISSDMRDLLAAMNTNQRAKLAVEAFCYNIKKYIGAYAAVMNGVDAVVFTGGIGENNALIRKKVLDDMEYLGIKIDAKKNVANKEIISPSASKVRVFVVKTDEEKLIAEESLACFRKLRTN